jgi:hypothetical protein
VNSGGFLYHEIICLTENIRFALKLLTDQDFSCDRSVVSFVTRAKGRRKGFAPMSVFTPAVLDCLVTLQGLC